MILNIGKGQLIFKGFANIGAGAKLSIDKDASLIFDNQFWSTGPLLIIARKQIQFGRNCVLSWNISVMDHDAHDIYHFKRFNYSREFCYCSKFGNNQS